MKTNVWFNSEQTTQKGNQGTETGGENQNNNVRQSSSRCEDHVVQQKRARRNGRWRGRQFQFSAQRGRHSALCFVYFFALKTFPEEANGHHRDSWSLKAFLGPQTRRSQATKIFIGILRK